MSDDVGRTVIQVSMTDAFLAEIEAIAERDRQADETKANRSRTIRRLIRKGIEAEKGVVR